jgi:hypothetical protein
MGDLRNAYKIFVEKSARKSSLGKTKRGWEDNIEMGLTKIGRKIVDRIHLSQYREQWRALVSTVMNPRVL